MATNVPLNLAKMSVTSVASAGLGDVTLNAASANYLSFANAGAVNAGLYMVLFREGSYFELSECTYTSSGTTLARNTVIVASDAEGVDTNKIVLTSAATAEIVLAASDINLRSPLGKQTMYIPASAMLSATTLGPSAAQFETSTNDINFITLDFSGSASGDEFAHFNVAFPKGWNESTVTYRVFWMSSATDTDGVAWQLQGTAVADNATTDASWGTNIVQVDNAQSNASELYVSSESSAVTIAGTPTADKLTFFRVSRDPDHASDTMTEDARLIGIQLYYTIDAATDA